MLEELSSQVGEPKHTKHTKTNYTYLQIGKCMLLGIPFQQHNLDIMESSQGKNKMK